MSPMLGDELALRPDGTMKADDVDTEKPGGEGTLPMARLLTDPAVEEWIQQMAASAPPMTEDQRARISRLIRFNGRYVPVAT